MSHPGNAPAPVDAACGGDDTAFHRLTEACRAELRVHCYRMLGSLDDAEDLVQETFLRAWRRRSTYAGRASPRAWLYKIATNACVDFLRSRPRQPLPYDPTTDAGAPPPVSVPWLQPCPDALLDNVAPANQSPEAAAEHRETVSLAFLVAIQHLPPRQRAVLILRDVLGWPARDTAEALETTVAAVNSSLQRARPTFREHLPAHRPDWRVIEDPTAQQQAVLRRYLHALERADEAALAALLADEARSGHQPDTGGHVGKEPTWYQGRDVLIREWAPVLRGPHAVDFRFLPLAFNRQPSFAAYVRARGSSSDFQAFVLEVLDIVDGRIVELTGFRPQLMARFDLPLTLPADHPTS
jgi:RNA polymerase sigma-70 factor, ECF subfamily